MKFDVFNRSTGNVQFTAEIDCDESEKYQVKLGIAVKWAVENGANLTDADLTGANLTDANLTDADLTGADLTGANLTDADLTGANLTGADLTGANLTDADLTGANLTDADLTGANLRRANLRRANLTGANLRRANLRRANLTDAELTGANLDKAKNKAFQIPQEGELIVWKKLRGEVLAKLRIPPEAKRTGSLVGRKCRAEFAEVLYLSEGTAGMSCYREKVEYVVGKVVKPDAYNDDPRVECASGIHFFLSKEEAEDY